MKVLTISTNDVIGGAAIAAYRLHKALLKIEVSSTMMVYNKTLNDSTITIGETQVDELRLFKKRLFNLSMLPYRKTKNRIFSTSSSMTFNFNKKIEDFNPDLVHLHWINSEFFKIESISRIKTPIVWSLHDMWPFTGGCHYTGSCDNYLNHCMKCPALGSTQKKDLSYSTFERKIKNFDPEKITFIGLSKWITNEARRSNLLHNFNIINIPNCINTDEFFPIEKIIARKILGLNHYKKIIAFGAMGGSKDPRKGFTFLIEAISFLDNPKDIEIICFGSEIKNEEVVNGVIIRFVGPIHDSKTIQILFSAADTTVVPSLEENLSNTIMESMACGTPAVAFDIGGNRDIIDHKQNGYLASLVSGQNLAEGINWVLFNCDSKCYSQSASSKISNFFDEKVISLRYKELYKNILLHN